MSDFYVYSVEQMPRVDLFGTGYNPNNDYIAFNGIYLEPIPAKTWVKIPDRFRSLRHHDRTDRQGHTYHVFADEIVKANRGRMGPRGVVFCDHEPTADEKLKLERDALEANTQFRHETIQFYEDQVREHETGNPARTKPTVYELECYQVLKVERPYSVAAFVSQRQPGKAVGQEIADAIRAVLAEMGIRPNKGGGTSAAKETHSIAKPAASV